MTLLKSIVALLIGIAVMPAYSQEPFSTIGNCAENTYGFVSIEGEGRNIPPMYCDAHSFAEGLAAVKNNQKWGFIDADNNVVILFQYDYARSFSGGLSIVKQGELYGVINKQGVFVIPPRYYDLSTYELEGKRYFISRDSTFFQGMIDPTGKEVLPHRFTYILTFEPNLAPGQRFYKNIPFYSVFRKIDSTKGSFYDQFAADAYQFAPEIGRHDIYDLQFNKLASKPSTDHSDGFQHEQLQQIDAFLEENGHKSGEEKRKAIDSILALPKPDSRPQADPANVSYGTMTADELNRYLDSLGYRLFTKNGKTGLKKGNEILIPAQHTGLQPVNGVIRFPQQEDIPLLETHYGGRYRDKEAGIFDVFAIIPRDGEPNEASYQYSLSGTFKLPVREVNQQRKKIISKITSLGFLYLHTSTDTAAKAVRTYELVNWKGDELIPPRYRKIEVLPSGHVLVTQEKEVKNGTEEHIGLLSNKGDKIIPLGVYSAIKPFKQSTGNLYLATWSDPYPMVAEKKENAYTNKTHVILKVEGHSAKVINSLTAGTVYPWHLDAGTGMLLYKKNSGSK